MSLAIFFLLCKYIEKISSSFSDTHHFVSQICTPFLTPFFLQTTRQPYTEQDIRYTYKNDAVYAFLMKAPGSSSNSR